MPSFVLKIRPTVPYYSPLRFVEATKRWSASSDLFVVLIWRKFISLTNIRHTFNFQCIIPNGQTWYNNRNQLSVNQCTCHCGPTTLIGGCICLECGIGSYFKAGKQSQTNLLPGDRTGIHILNLSFSYYFPSSHTTPPTTRVYPAQEEGKQLGRLLLIQFIIPEEFLLSPLLLLCNARGRR